MTKYSNSIFPYYNDSLSASTSSSHITFRAPISIIHCQDPHTKYIPIEVNDINYKMAIDGFLLLGSRIIKRHINEYNLTGTIDGDKVHFSCHNITVTICKEDLIDDVEQECKEFCKEYELAREKAAIKEKLLLKQERLKALNVEAEKLALEIKELEK